MSFIVQRLNLNRFEADEYYKQALEDYDKEDFEEGILKMGQAISMLPNNAEYHAARGMMYYRAGIHDEARKDFEKALSLYPHEMLAHYGLGAVAYHDQRYDDAARHFDAAYRLDAKRPETLYFMALTHHKLGYKEFAIPIMRMAHDLFPEADARRKDAMKWLRLFES